MTPAYFTFAKAALWHFVRARWITWQEYNRLVHDVAQKEWKYVGCAGKIPFESFEIAQQVARKQPAGRDTKARIAYHCKVCGKYHLASAKRGGDVRRARKKMKQKKLLGEVYA